MRSTWEAVCPVWTACCVLCRRLSCFVSDVFLLHELTQADFAEAGPNSALCKRPVTQRYICLHNQTGLVWHLHSSGMVAISCACGSREIQQALLEWLLYAVCHMLV